ncbi:helix-turn-helix domain-containing protein [Streptomyces jumonjinensis]|uniref:Helix-turn-helix transcriptional regulator n=1 Tax=Streptomyces jumonjinensis TaxID=1945 RepID=A0A646KMV0_STRJU|nr:helix-turn-helix transcriptional regulator [Streptomyces jumonjinensis]MQT03251.1 helix-turn-helix transcriptional regulator [Streptomyces jumonjinensis]
MEKKPTAGENIAVLRKARGVGQARLSQEMGITVSYLSKIETGLRPATPPIVASAAKALRVTTARVHGAPFSDPSEQSDLITDLRGAVRRHTLPSEATPSPDELAAGLREAAELRAGTRYLELLNKLPKLLGQATATAMDSGGDAVAWGQVADLYGCAYTVAHRFAEPDLADMIVSRQQWAAVRTWNPGAEAAASWNEAGTHQSAGAYADGLAIVDRAISQYERAQPMGCEAVVVLGALHLRGVVLASRHKDKNATQAHLRGAKVLAEQMPQDMLLHNLTFGPGNTALYELAAHVEMKQPGKAVEMATPMVKKMPVGLARGRVGRFHIDRARAHLAINDLTGAEAALKEAFAISPQMAEIHPMSREVLRVLFVLHQRARPDLLVMAKRTGLTT